MVDIVFISDEEISAMRKELDKYGIQMPTFSKIGGILANEVGHLCISSLLWTVSL